MFNRPFLTALLAAAAMSGAAAARADDFIVYSPYVTDGQSEVELRGHQQYDGDPGLDMERAYSLSFAHAFTPWWKTEVYAGRYEREPGSANTFEGYEFESVFQLSQQGEYWADLGFLAAYEHNTLPGEPGIVEFGPLFERHDGQVTQRLNFIWEKELNSGSRQYEFRATYAMNYRLNPMFMPGLEAYYRPADESRQIGPALYGEVPFAGGNQEFEYVVAFLLGTNRGAADRTLVLRLEYEFN